MHSIECCQFLNCLFSLDRFNSYFRLEFLVVVFAHSELYASLSILCKKASVHLIFHQQWSKFKGSLYFAHVRRKFIEAQKLGSKEASIFISMIGELYEKEAELRREYKEGLLTTESFLSLRRKEQAPKLTSMHAWLIAHAGVSPPTLAFGKAVSYALSQWEKITHYLDHELLTPDTNRVENAIRPFVIGRKNWLFSNTPLGAMRVRVFIA